MKKQDAFALVELLVTAAVIVVLVAILTPVLASVKRASQRASSVSKLQQLFLTVELYRHDYGGDSGSYYSYKSLALPTNGNYDNRRFDLPLEAVESSCGEDRTIFESGPGGRFAWFIYGPPHYRPGINQTIGNPLRGYLEKYRQNAVLFCDPYCNPAGTVMSYPLTSKRGIAVLLSGQIVNRIRQGRGDLFQFYSDLPE